jgi:hypothetical protein
MNKVEAAEKYRTQVVPLKIVLQKREFLSFSG